MIGVKGMSGVAPKITPELLPDNKAQTALNTRLFNGGVRSLREPVTVATPTKSGVAKTIYRFGKNAGESQYWFKWTGVVNVARGPIPGDTEETTYYTGDGTPKKTRFSLATSSGTNYPVASYELKVPAPTGAPVLDPVTGTGPTVTEQRAYVYTNVTAWGEESAPSPASIGTATATNYLRVSGFTPLPAGAYNWASRRIYRSVTTSQGTNYYFVGEIAAGASYFDDNVSNTAVGEVLATLDWDAPPDTLTGLIALPSGALCGFSGKEVCFSVPNAPYAWPQKYRLTTDYNIVAVAPMGQGVAVLTDGYPYFINTGDPEAAQMIRFDEEQSCVSARSVVSLSGAVIYASPDGLVSLSQSGAQLVTKDLFDRDTWQAQGPTNIFAAKHDGRYYGFLTSGGFILDLNGDLTYHDVTATACYVDPVNDALYVAVGTNIQKWDAGANKTHTYKTKRYNLPRPMMFTAAQVKANTFSNLVFNIYYDKVLKASIPVTAPNPFRLPSGKAQLVEFEIVGTDHWTVAAIAQSIEELMSV